MPGSAPPITPTSVPKNSGSRYFSCATLRRPCQSRSNIRTRPRAARQQHQQVALEHQIPHRRGADRDRSEHRPVARRSRPAERGLQRGDEQDGGEAKPEQRQQHHVGADHRERDHDQPIVARGARCAGLGRRAMFDDVLHHQQRARGRHEGQHDGRVKARPDRNDGKGRKLERLDQQDQADREQDQPGNSVAADAHFLIRPRSVMTTLFSSSILARNAA